MTTISKLDNELLKAHVLGKPREFLVANPDTKLNFLQKIKLHFLIKKRQKNIPFAYLTKHKEFFGLNFVVNKHVLVPRADTELMVETVLSMINEQRATNKHMLLIDVGTGSGCIPISILDSIRKSGLSKYPNCYAIDISKKALKIAKQNAKKHNVKIEFLHGNLLTPFIKNCNLQPNTHNLLITANLPYITERQFQSEPSIQKEPKLALVAKGNGLALYEELLTQIKHLSTTYNLQPITYLEIDPSQTERIKIIIKKYLPEAHIEIKKDLASLDRLVVIKN